MLLKAKCEISMKKFPQAEVTLQNAMSNPECNKTHAKAAFINLYKQWGEKQDIGLKIALTLLKDMSTDSNFETIRKALRDFMYFFLNIPPKFINEIVSQDVLANVIKDAFHVMQQESKDPDFDSLFERFIETNLDKSLTDMGKLEDICKRMIKKIADENLRDIIFEKYLRNKEQISSYKQITDLLKEGNKSEYFGLPSFSCFSLKYGYGFNDLEDHFNILLTLFKNRQAFFTRSNRGDILFLLQTVSDISAKAQSILKASLPVLSEDDILLMDKNQKELGLDLSKKTSTDIVRNISILVSKTATQESISFVLRFVKEHEALLPFE